MTERNQSIPRERIRCFSSVGNVIEKVYYVVQMLLCPLHPKGDFRCKEINLPLWEWSLPWLSILISLVASTCNNNSMGIIFIPLARACPVQGSLHSVMLILWVPTICYNSSSIPPRQDTIYHERQFLP